MKLIVSILMLVIVTFAQNTTYLDGTDCICDSIIKRYRIYDGIVFSDEVPYVNGKVYGVKKTYISGKLVVEDPYIKGERNGIYKVYFDNGNISEAYQYSNGYENGISKEFYKNGKTKILQHFINGGRNGVKKWYYESGKLAGTANYKNGTLTGYKKCTDGRMGNENLDCLN